MLIGVGIDTVEIARVEALLARFGARFQRKCFTDAEIVQGNARHGARKAAFFAKRIAAKEACAKALGVGLGTQAAWREIEIITSPGGRPELHVHGVARATLYALAGEGYRPRLHVSLTDTDAVAQAIVNVEAVPL